jgi:clan AA aspartic protease
MSRGRDLDVYDIGNPGWAPRDFRVDGRGRARDDACMGLAHANLILRNPRRPELRPLEVRALADTDAYLLCIPEHVAIQLSLEQAELREVTTADGVRRRVPYVGPLEVRFENRSCFVAALVLGDDVLLGAIPMEDLDVVVSPRDRAVVVNPSSPNIPTSRA